MRLLGLLLLLMSGPAALAGGGDGWVRLDTTMADGRWAPAAAVLAGGRTALIVGGYSYTTRRCVASADLFDENSQRFRPCKGRLNAERDFATATLLPSGAVLIAGGFNTHTGTLDTAEVYHPATEDFRPLPSRLSCGRELFQATSLADGRVLLTGGLDLWTGRTQDSADLFDPKTETFSRVPAPMATGRFGHAAVLLPDGRVLIVGGKSVVLGQSETFLASAEIFDPRTRRFHPTRTPMHVPRDRPTATLLPDGTVLVAGGQNGAEEPRQAEVFDPRTETFTTLAVPLIQPRMAHCAVPLPGGQILLAGGWNVQTQATLDSVENYDLKTREFHLGPPLPDATHDAAMLVFSDGLVLIAGGKQVQGGKESSLASGATWHGKTP